MNLSALLYALWESFFCVAFIIALLGITRARFNYQGKWMKFFSENTFGIYVFHAPVLITVSLLLKGVQMDPLAKFFLAGTITITVAVWVSWLIRKIPVVGPVFD